MGTVFNKVIGIGTILREIAKGRSPKDVAMEYLGKINAFEVNDYPTGYSEAAVDYGEEFENFEAKLAGEIEVFINDVLNQLTKADSDLKKLILILKTDG